MWIEFYNKLNDFERKLPVDQWVINDIHIWPYIKTRFKSIKQDEQRKLYSIEPLKNPNRYKEIFQNLIITLKSKRVDKFHNAKKKGPIDCVFLMISNSRYTKFKEQWYSSLYDTLILNLNKVNKSFLSLEYYPDNVIKMPRYSDSRLIHPKLNFLKLKGKLIQKINKKKISVHLPEVNIFINELKSMNLNHPILNIDEIIYQAIVMRLRVNYFKKILKKLNAKIGIEICWYNPEVMAFNVACSELGIPSLEIQHGTIAENAVAYDNWFKFPKDGYNLMPSNLWVWGENEKKIVEKWCADKEFITVINGGHPWINHWYDNKMISLFIDEKDLKLFKENKAEKNILVTLQPVSKYDELFKIIQDAPNNWFWWIRLHPRQRHEMENYLTKFQKFNIKNVNIKEATSLPLPFLLSKMDCHLTKYSSVIIEAEKFGVPSVTYSENALEHFQHQIENGFLINTLNESEVVDYLKKQIEFKSDNIVLTQDKDPNKNLNILTQIFKKYDI